MATYLYSKECPQGRIFNTQEEVEDALKKGWFDAPGKWDDQKSPGPLVDTQHRGEHKTEPKFFDKDAAPDDEKHKPPKGK